MNNNSHIVKKISSNLILSLKFLCIAFFMLCSCSTSNQEHQESKDQSAIAVDPPTLPEAPFVTDPSEKQILSITDTLFKGDTLSIKFKTPHFKDLAIITPEDKFFFVVYALHDPAQPSLVDWNTFAHLDHLEIITDKTKANPWDARIKKNQLIFTKTGRYEIRLSENLETDDGTPVELATVYYFDKPVK